MKNIFSTLKFFIGVIAVLVLAAGIVLTALGAFDLVKVIVDIRLADTEHLGKIIAIGLLSVVDLFLIAIVFFVLALGVMLLFMDPDKGFPINLPNWLRIKSFIELKVILWEAILTTLVIAFLTGLAGKKINGEPIDVETLIVPAGIFLISVSLYFLKKGKHE